MCAYESGLLEERHFVHTKFYIITIYACKHAAQWLSSANEVRKYVECM